jgi:hypothetical protein
MISCGTPPAKPAAVVPMPPWWTSGAARQDLRQGGESEVADVGRQRRRQVIG